MWDDMHDVCMWVVMAAINMARQRHYKVRSTFVFFRERDNLGSEKDQRVSNESRVSFLQAALYRGWRAKLKQDELT